MKIVVQSRCRTSRDIAGHLPSQGGEKLSEEVQQEGALRRLLYGKAWPREVCCSEAVGRRSDNDEEQGCTDIAWQGSKDILKGWAKGEALCLGKASTPLGPDSRDLSDC